MKKLLSLLLLVSMLASLGVTLASCASDKPNTDGGFTYEDDNNKTPDKDNNDDNNDDTNGDNGDDDPQTPTPPPVTDPREEDYAYTPYLPTEMPEIRVTTDEAEGHKNEFATSITDISQKWNDEIQYVGCNVTVGNCDSAYTLSADGQIKVRGNYTIMFPKQPFRLKFNSKQNLLGMNDGQKYKSWVLLAEWKDSSMLFDPTAYFLGQTILGSDGYYCTDYRLVKLYLNDTYWGVYLLAEQQQTGTGRVDIAEPEKDYIGTDIGYFVEYDGYYDKEDPAKGGDYTFTIDYNTNAPLKEASGATADAAFYRGYTIKSDIYSDAQQAFVKKYFGNAYIALSEAVVNGVAYTIDDHGDLTLREDMTPEDAIRSIIDVQSLVDTYILNEICCDYDLHWSSFYLSLDMSATGNKKITFCAPWDFDTAFGSKNSSKCVNKEGETKYSGKGACENAEGLYAGNNRNPWLLLLVNETWFTDAVEAKWAELLKYDVLDRALAQIETVTELYETQMIENATRAWDRKTTWQYSTPQVYHVGDPSPTKELVNTIANCKTQAEASARLYKWLTLRFNALNKIWGDGTLLYK